MTNDQRQRQREAEWAYIEENDPVLSMQLAVMGVLGESVSGGEIAEERAWMLPAAEDLETERAVVDIFLGRWKEVKEELAGRFPERPSYREIDACCENWFDGELDDQIRGAPHRQKSLEAVRPAKYLYQLYNLLEDMETCLLDTGERDACVSFCRDRLELFDFADAPEEEARIREILSGADQ